MSMETTDTSKSAMTSDPSTYFANQPTVECAYSYWDRIEAYYNEMRRTGRLSLYRNSFMNMYMGWVQRASMFRGGEQGELTRSFWNHERNILLHLKTQTTQNKITYKSQVKNSSSTSSTLVEFANGLSEYYATCWDYDLDSKFKQTVEDCLVYSEASIVGLWNRFKGKPVVNDPMTGQIFNEGDMDYFSVTPLDQIINTVCQDRYQVQWRVVRRWVNKYDWASMYPNFRSQVLGLQDLESNYGTKLVTLIHHDDETIPVFYCFHEKTPAVPKGRLLIMATPQCIFEDGPLDQGEGKKGYDHVPIYDMIVTTMAGSPYGYTVAFDLIPLQQSLNELISAVITNNINFATQCVTGPKGANIKYQFLASGMSYLEWDPKIGVNGKPEALNLLHSAPETYQLIDKHIQHMNMLANISSMERGQPDINITSGQYAALVSVQSVIFNSDLQKAYARMCEKTMTGTIRTLRKNMIVDKVVRITGDSMQAYSKTFSNSELAPIESISVEIANPMIQTPAGKMNLADNLLKQGIIKDGQEYIGVYTDGDLPNLYKRQETQLRLIKEENEAILRGEMIMCQATDIHVSHILEHACMTDSLEARKDPKILKAAFMHIQDHLNKLAGGVNPFNGKPEGPINPILAGIIGDPTLPPGTPSQIQLPPMQGAQPRQALPGGMPNAQNGPPQDVQQQSKPGMPAQPTNKLPNTGVQNGAQPVGMPNG